MPTGPKGQKRPADVIGNGLPPEKWSSLRYGSRELKEDVSDGDEEAQTGGDCREAAAD
jgi:hypothetical protein